MKKIYYSITALVLVLWIVGCGNNIAQLEKVIQEGDLVFQNLEKSPDTNLWTALDSEYNHVGIVIKIDDKFMVYTVDDEVKYVPFGEYIKRGSEGHYLIKRMLNSTGKIDKLYSYEIRNATKWYKNRTYDYQLEIDNKRVYEPEIVWKIYREAFMTELGPLARLSSIDFSSPQAQQYLKRHFNGSITKDQEIITMDQILYCEFLEVVAKG